ncbi:YybH family protein [Nocardia brasiliensis]
MTTNHDQAAAVHAEFSRYIDRWVELFNARDIAGLADLYEPAGIVVPSPGHPISGAGLSAALTQFAESTTSMKATLRQVYQADDIALLLIDWTMEGSAPDGQPVTRHGTATDVARRGADGRWRYLIDNPSGTAGQ